MGLLDIPEEERRERYYGLKTKHWNRLAEFIAKSGVAASHFNRGPRDNLSSFEDRIEYRSTTRYFKFVIDVSGGGRGYVARFSSLVFTNSFPFIGHRWRPREDAVRVRTIADVYAQFAKWLERLREVYEYDDFVRREKDKESRTPDLWDVLLKSPSANAAHVWTPEYEFKQGDVDDFNSRMSVVLDEIEVRQLLTPEIRDIVREEIESRRPQVGQKWGVWRERFVGWLVGKVLDGDFNQTVLTVIQSGISGYLVAKQYLTHLLQ